MVTYYPSIDRIRGLSGRGKTFPVLRRLLADQMTPVGVFARLGRSAERAFLLESVVGAEQVARYTFVGAAPSLIYRVRRDTSTIERDDGSVEVRAEVGDPINALQTLLRDYRSVSRDDLDFGRVAVPRFAGGAVGYAAYDTIRYYENLPDAPTDDRGLDDLDFAVYDRLVIFDHVNSTLLVVAHARLDSGSDDEAYHDACRRIDETVAQLARPAPPLSGDLDLDGGIGAGYSSSLNRAQYEDAVRRSIEYILAGDIFQVVLSQRLRAESDADPLDVYRALRVINPSPFMFYVKGPRCTLIGASPEILCRVEDGVITNRPLAGTRPRGGTAAEDAALERELLADPKDRAEHIMLVDLGRNDVGRVADPGTVDLSDVMTIERYSHVMHISSNVTGRLADGATAADALRASLPVGTVSGAPKIRAMQIIDELEPVRRGPYGGAVGYLDFAGNMDMCIALRTIVGTPSDTAGRWTYDIQAGAGIVADSNPAAEYEETLNKAKALLAALRAAEGTPDARVSR